jgi:hypothetical protein
MPQQYLQDAGPVHFGLTYAVSAPSSMLRKTSRAGLVQNFKLWTREMNASIQTAPMSTPLRTKARISHLATRVNRKPFTQDELQLVLSYSRSSLLLFARPSKTDSVLRSCTITSDDSKVMYTSVGDVHCSGEGDEGRSHAASHHYFVYLLNVNVTHLPVAVQFQK